MSVKTQLAVIGAGPGGYAVAFYAADLGLEVTLIDLEKNPGGTCLYRGCIPSKAYLHVAKILSEAKHAEACGITFGEPKINIDKVRAFKEDIVEKLTTGNGGLAKQRKINYLQGRAFFENNNKLSVKLINPETDQDRVEIEFDKAIIATGSVPSVIPGLSIDSPYVMNSDIALDLPDVPKKMLVIGGGIIGCEMATFYAGLGSEVTIVELLPQILTGADKDLARVVAGELSKKVKAIYTNTKVVSLKEIENGVEVNFEGKKVEETIQKFDKVLIAIGRSPVTKGLGLENTNVKVSDRGFIEIDEYFRTDADSIYAIGDVVGQPMLAHKAHAEGRIAVDNIAGTPTKFTHKTIPSVVYTDPELGWVGLTEAEAKEKGIKVKAFRFPWAANGRALTQGRIDGTTKIIVDPESEIILGFAVAGPGAGELLAEGALAVEKEMKAKDLAHLIHAHPTLSETVMEAAEMVYGTATHIYRPKRK